MADIGNISQRGIEMRRWVFTLLILYTSIGLLLCYGLYVKKCKPKVIIKKVPVKTDNNTQSFLDVDILTEWVYSHSSRISRKTARRIVETTIKETKYPLLILSLMERESNFNPLAISKSGAIGLGQILASPAQIKWLKENKIISEKRDLFDIETNIRATNFIFLYKLKKANGNLEKALMFYVGGNQRRYIKDILTNLGEIYILLKNGV